MYRITQRNEGKKIRVLCISIVLFLCVCVQWLSHVQFFEVPWTVVHQATLSMELSRQEYWSGLPFPPPWDLPDPGTEPASPALAGRFFTTEPPGKPLNQWTKDYFYFRITRLSDWECSESELDALKQQMESTFSLAMS